MNLKLFGRNIEKFKCKEHLCKDCEITHNQYNEWIVDFRNKGCNLF